MKCRFAYSAQELGNVFSEAERSRLILLQERYT